MAFQIKDDLFDYSNSDVGKPTGHDIREKKITLPLIYTLNNCGWWMRRKLIRIIKHKNTDRPHVDFLIDQVKKTGGIQYAHERMLAYRDAALNILNDFPKSEAQSALEELVRYTTDRTY